MTPGGRFFAAPTTVTPTPRAVAPTSTPVRSAPPVSADTVAHRLARVKELTDLDPALSEDRERLGLGIKAYRLLAPTLPR